MIKGKVTGMIIAGNWKMNMDRQGAAALTSRLVQWRSEANNTVSMVLFPPSILIDVVSASLTNAGNGGGILMGGQDCHHDASGAHTGDIAAPMLSEAGCSWVLVGHSERRQNHGEDSALVCRKAQSAVDAGISPMICVGETLSDCDNGHAQDVVAEQIRASLPDGLAPDRFAIAYEPVWAIGTGKVADNADVEAMHNHIRALLISINDGYKDVPILYGGSVKADNAAGLLALDNVNGTLVGGASLKAEEFIAIAEAASALSNIE